MNRYIVQYTDLISGKTKNIATIDPHDKVFMMEYCELLTFNKFASKIICTFKIKPKTDHDKTV